MLLKKRNNTNKKKPTPVVCTLLAGQQFPAWYSQEPKIGQIPIFSRISPRIPSKILKKGAILLYTVRSGTKICAGALMYFGNFRTFPGHYV